MAGTSEPSGDPELADQLPAHFTEHVYKTPEQRAEAAALPNKERKERTESMLIRYPRFVEAQAAVKRFHASVDEGGHDARKICGLLGSYRAGKSAAVVDYVRRLGMKEVDRCVVPAALYVSATNSWTNLSLLQHLIRRSGLPNARSKGASESQRDLVEDIREFGIELVVIDDAQNLLVRNKFLSTVQEALGTIVAISAACNVILVGTPDITQVVAARGDAYGRGGWPHHVLQPFDWGDQEQRKQFRFLLQMIDDRLPFREPSRLAATDVAAHFWRVSHGGILGWIHNYIRPAAALAINERADRIEVEHLQRAAQDLRKIDDKYEPFMSVVSTTDPADVAKREAQARLQTTSGFKEVATGKRGRAIRLKAS